jgi:hypothetical protein
MGKAAMNSAAALGALPPSGERSLSGIEDDDYRSLALMVPTDRDSKTTEELRWAARYAFCHPAEINPEDVPSRTAILLLQIAQSDKQKFFEQWVKLLPSKQQVDIMEKFKDDGRNALTALDAFWSDIDEEAAQESQGEPGLAQEAAGAGGEQ